MAEDHQEWIEGDVRRSSFGSFGIRCQKRKRKSGDDEGGEWRAAGSGLGAALSATRARHARLSADSDGALRSQR